MLEMDERVLFCGYPALGNGVGSSPFPIGVRWLEGCDEWKMEIGDFRTSPVWMLNVSRGETAWPASGRE